MVLDQKTCHQEIKELISYNKINILILPLPNIYENDRLRFDNKYLDPFIFPIVRDLTLMLECMQEIQLVQLVPNIFDICRRNTLTYTVMQIAVQLPQIEFKIVVLD